MIRNFLPSSEILSLGDYLLNDFDCSFLTCEVDIKEPASIYLLILYPALTIGSAAHS